MAKQEIPLSNLYGEPKIMDNGEAVEIVAHIPQGENEDDNHLYIVVNMSSALHDDFGIDSIQSIYSDFECNELPHGHLDIDAFVILVDKHHNFCQEAYDVQHREWHENQKG